MSVSQYDDAFDRVFDLTKAFDMFRGIPAPDSEPCAHCGQPRRGGARINGSAVCHTDPPFPDCYRLVTVYGERLGERHPDRTREQIVRDIAGEKGDPEFNPGLSLAIAVARGDATRP